MATLYNLYKSKDRQYVLSEEYAHNVNPNSNPGYLPSPGMYSKLSQIISPDGFGDEASAAALHASKSTSNRIGPILIYN